MESSTETTMVFPKTSEIVKTMTPEMVVLETTETSTREVSKVVSEVDYEVTVTMLTESTEVVVTTSSVTTTTFP